MLKNFLICLLSIILCFCCYYGLIYYRQITDKTPQNFVVTNFSFQNVIDKAKQLSKMPYAVPDTIGSSELLNLSYDQYRDIRFVRKNGPWYNQKLPYEVQFFHLGSIFKIPVKINEVVNNVSKPINFSAKYFDYGNNKFNENDDEILGYAGFRIHSPLNTSAYYDELVTFLGASYFRGLAKGQKYGLSARGLAINTAEMIGEEFPIFKEFWLQKPKTKDKVITLYALLDSKSVSGAYRFEIIPGANTIMNIEAHLFPRENIQKIGIAPLTSMFLFGENNKNDFDDFRLEVHDSDGLLVHNGHGEWLWRPLDNSKKLRISSFVDNGLKGFGLLQRDRDLSNYQDFEANYQSRPSAWVEPLESWNDGYVQLVEIPSRQEIHDNIVAYWVPKTPIEAAKEYKFSYRLIWLNDVMKEEDIAYVSATRTGQGGISGTEGISESRKFVIDFIGKNLGSDFSQKGITPNVSAISGKIINVSAIYNPITKGITVYADYAPHSDNDEIRISLEQNGKTISEVWSYQWLK